MTDVKIGDHVIPVSFPCSFTLVHFDRPLFSLHSFIPPNAVNANSASLARRISAVRFEQHKVED